ncbi:MAG: hypothetical protein LKJ69_01710 [Lactobacillus sp.]|jgi:hypothetical protein|nr:hypothetical protein [Lactobacillus sp.]MCI2032100.1 hypothetical protein [Lactobacillus sp.]
MTDLERIEDMYPQLTFYGVEVKSPHYHGHIQGHEVYINTLQPDIDWLETAIHEALHFEFDSGDCSDTRELKIIKNEGWTRRQARLIYTDLFGLPDLK